MLTSERDNVPWRNRYMTTEYEHKNRLWWMISAVVLLFVAAAAMPVAAVEWPSNNDTFIVPANGMRTNGDNLGNDHDFQYDATEGYYFWMVNGTQGMNAIHITNSPSSPYGQLTNSTAESGSFYVSSTGGHTGEDNALLLIAVNSTNSTDLNNFAIDLTASGYNWDPLSGAAAPTLVYTPANLATYNTNYYNSSALSGSFTAADYLNDGFDEIAQRWKFAPLPNYPLFGGQNMAADKDFKLILVDLNAGITSTSLPHYTYLNDRGEINVTYTITSNPTSPMNVTFNSYVYNWDAPQAKRTIHWINALIQNGGTAPSGYQVIL
jgi:hypothetical protein